jgi:hypothetical protein
MAALGWQDAVVAAVVVLAGAWLVRRQLRRRRLRTPLCDDCPACAAKTHVRPPVAAGGGLIPVSDLTRPEGGAAPTSARRFGGAPDSTG